MPRLSSHEPRLPILAMLASSDICSEHELPKARDAQLSREGNCGKFPVEGRQQASEISDNCGIRIVPLAV